MQIEPIGVVRSPVVDEVDADWGDVVSTIEVVPQLAEGLEGLDGFSHLLVIFFMHRSSFDPARDLRRRPRGRADMPLLGIFAQRAKHRPNPIGVTAVRLLQVEGNVVRVQGLDAVDGTPVLDLKPYAPVFDQPLEPVIPEWFERLMEGCF